MMLRGRSFAFFALPLLASVGCGGGEKPAPKTAPTTTPVASAPPAQAPVDLSPVPLPDGLFLVGRVGNPDGIVKAVGSWAHIPLPGGRELVRSITDDSVADMIDLSQPVDGAMMLSGMGMRMKPLVAFSVAVKSLEDAKAKLGTGAGHKVTPGPNGSYRVEGIGQREKEKKPRRPGRRGEQDEDDDDSNSDPQNCVLAPTPSGGRLVCGDGGALETLVPYLTRTLPREKFTSDIHLEVHPEPIREPLNQIRSSIPILLRGLFNTSSPAFREIADSSVGEVVDLVNDAQKIAIDAQVADTGLNATTRIEFQKSTSLIARIATSRPDKAEAPPAAFWHLPADADVAFFGRGSDPQLFDRPRKLLANVILEGAEMAGVPEAERKTVRDLVADRIFSLFSNGPVMYAKGYDGAAIEKALVARAKVKPDDLGAMDEADRLLGEQVIGWHLFQVSEPVDKVGGILKDVAGLWNRPAFAKWVKEKASTKMQAKVRIAPTPAGVTLPKDSVHLEITIPREDIEEMPASPPPPPPRPGAKPAPTPPLANAKKPKTIPRKPVIVHVLAVPDAKNGTFLAFGLDPKLLAQKAAASLSTAPDTNTLGKATGYEALREGKMNGAGAVSIRGLLVFTALDRERSPFTRLAQLPNKGATPLLLTFKAEPPSDTAKGGSATSTLKLPRGAIEDLVRMFMR